MRSHDPDTSSFIRQPFIHILWQWCNSYSSLHKKEHLWGARWSMRVFKMGFTTRIPRRRLGKALEIAQSFNSSFTESDSLSRWTRSFMAGEEKWSLMGILKGLAEACFQSVHVGIFDAFASDASWCHQYLWLQEMSGLSERCSNSRCAPRLSFAKQYQLPEHGTITVKLW